MSESHGGKFKFLFSPCMKIFFFSLSMGKRNEEGASLYFEKNIIFNKYILLPVYQRRGGRQTLND